MTNSKTLSILTVAALGLYAVSADATEMNKAKTDVTQTQTESRTSLQAKTAVLEASETQDLIRVSDDEGNVFYNHVVNIEDLPETELDIEIQDTYTFEHNGRTYTNVIVEAS